MWIGFCCHFKMRHLVNVFVGAVFFTRHVHATNFTSLVNLFIGTASGAGGASGGNAFPGKGTLSDLVEYLNQFHYQAPLFPMPWLKLVLMFQPLLVRLVISRMGLRLLASL